MDLLWKSATGRRIFIYQSLLDCFFYNAVNSLIINLGYYGIFYVLYRTNTITFDMNTIILMFGFGMVVHYVISLIQEKVFFKKNENIG